MRENLLSPKLNINNSIMIVFISILIAILSLYHLDMIFIAIIFFGTMILIYSCKNIMLRRVLFISFFIRILLIIIHFYFFNLPDSDGDAVGFENMSWDISELWHNGFVSPYEFLGSANVYGYVGAVIYYVIGRFEPALVLINTSLSILTLRMVYHIAESYNLSQRAKIITVAFFSLFPTFLLYSVLNLREMFVVTFATISYYYFTKWIRDGKTSFFYRSLIFIMLSSTFHGGMFLIFVVYCFIFCLYSPKTKKVNIFSKRIIIGIIVGSGFYLVYSNYLANKLPNNFDISIFQKSTISTATSRAAYLVGYYPSSVYDFIVQTPVRVFYFLLSPFPWNFSSPSDAIGIIDSLCYLFMALFGIKGMLNLRKTNKMIFWTIFLLSTSMLCSFSWGVSNYGTAIRHREKMIWVFIPIAMHGLSLSNWRHFFLRLFMIK